ncbi:MAG: GIY-YIG nuclease family protein [Clostridia bacterium]|nr:GIY-YIG nuclease family protein [Clostridia bacterium]
MKNNYYVYIMTNKNNQVMYVGVTNDIYRRVEEHKAKKIDGFTKKYNVTKLVYCESTAYVENAIEWEKKIKGWTRAKKNALVESLNPEWKDLSEEW